MKDKTPFTGYWGMWSAVSKKFVYGIQEKGPRAAQRELRRLIGWDALKWRFEAKKIRTGHHEMFYGELKQKQKARFAERTQNKKSHIQFTTNKEEVHMNITLTIEAPELVGAIESLAAALGNAGSPLPVTAPAPAPKKEEPKKETPKKEAPKKDPAPVKDEPKTAPVKEEPKTEPAKEEPKEEATISLEVVRGKLADFSAGGKENQLLVKDALSRFGVKKLTDVEPSDYAELLELVGLSE